MVQLTSMFILAAIALSHMKKIATTPTKAKISFLLIIPPPFFGYLLCGIFTAHDLKGQTKGKG